MPNPTTNADNLPPIPLTEEQRFLFDTRGWLLFPSVLSDTETKEMREFCYIHLAPHNPLGPVSTAACLHLCLASSLVGVQELPRAPMSSLTDVFPVQVPYESWHLLPPESPGLGIEFNEEALKNVTTQQYGPPHGYQRDDRSFTNW